MSFFENARLIADIGLVFGEGYLIDRFDTYNASTVYGIPYITTAAGGVLGALIGWRYNEPEKGVAIGSIIGLGLGVVRRQAIASRTEKFKQQSQVMLTSFSGDDLPPPE